ncbi:hypothetical protein [Kordiimonas sp.]|uniref:hypothetical protein n=1 Tax=Kordiimonas sp. TaxID=1970157 RepID=UPI003A92AE85
MKTFQKFGGLAAILEAAAYIFGFSLYFTVFTTPVEGGLMGRLAFAEANSTILFIQNLIIYVGFGALLIVLTLALYDRMKTLTPALSLTAAGFGIVWATLVIASGMLGNVGLEAALALKSTDADAAAMLLKTTGTVQNGLGGGNEIVGGIWVLLISIAGLRSAALPRFLNYLGLVVGGAGLLSTIPGLGDLGAIFGLGQIVWFIWIGAAMIRSPEVQQA